MVARVTKRLLSKGLLLLGLEIRRSGVRGREPLPAFLDVEFGPLYRRHCHQTMVPWQTLYTAYEAAKYVALTGVPGAIVECGVWRGGCSILMAETLRTFGIVRKIYLFDTFLGMAAPTEEDRKSATGVPAMLRFRQTRKEEFTAWCYSPYEEVLENIRDTNYPFEEYKLIPGPVEKTLPETIPERIALLRLDMDLYRPTSHALKHLWPRLSEGGILLVDDYGNWAGAKQAVDEFFQSIEYPVFLQTDPYSGAVTAVKRESQVEKGARH